MNSRIVSMALAILMTASLSFAQDNAAATKKPKTAAKTAKKAPAKPAAETSEETFPNNLNKDVRVADNTATTGQNKVQPVEEKK